MKWYRPGALEKENKIKAEERKRRAKDFQDKEKSQVQNFVRARQTSSTNALDSPTAHQIYVDGIPFTFNKSCNKLVRPAGI